MNENVAIITGTAGKDPELRYTTGGSGVCSFSIATNRRWKNKRTDEWDEETTWHNIVVWGELGEHVAQSVEKGNRVTVVGRISNRSYDDREGNKKYISEIIADSVAVELRFATAVVEKVERDSSPRQSQSAPPPSEEPF